MRSRQRCVVLAVGVVALSACGGEQEEIFDDPAPALSVPPSEVVETGGVAPSEQAGTDVDDDGVGTDIAAVEPVDDFNSELSGGVVEYDDADRYTFADTTGAELTADQVDSIFIAYDDFLYGADAVWLAGEPGAPGLAQAGLVDFQLVEYQESIATEIGELRDVFSSSNIEKISGSAEAGVVVEDCMESSVTNALYIVSPDFVRQNVTLAATDDGWTVVAVDIIHDGQLTSLDEPGCVPAIYAEQAEIVTSEFLRLEAELAAQPDGDVPALRDVTTPEFYEVVRSNAAASESDRVSAGTERIVLDTLGSSPLAGPRTLYVGVCRTAGDGAAGSLLFQEYEVTRGLADGFPDTGDGRDVYAVSDRSPVEQVETCPVGNES